MKYLFEFIKKNSKLLEIILLLFHILKDDIQKLRGYTRILKTSVRRGDNAQLAIIELVDKLAQEVKEETTSVNE
ncbi:MAG: hypothetical protein IE878_04420 [Epsilonproteobacteria bacterium]|nr:hypothetical protein [Campylobacterota bacterium]